MPDKRNQFLEKLKKKLNWNSAQWKLEFVPIDWETPRNQRIKVYALCITFGSDKQRKENSRRKTGKEIICPVFRCDQQGLVV